MFRRYRLIIGTLGFLVGLVLAASVVNSHVFLNEPKSPIGASSRDAELRTVRQPRNLAVQPEAAKLSRKLGKRFTRAEVSSLTGEVTVNSRHFSLQIVRRQHERGERLEITTSGSPNQLTWNDSEGSRSNGTRAAGFDRSLVERVVFDSADHFVLAQLRGASYYTIARNVRPDEVGDSYEGPVWTVVRVNDPADEERRPENSWRLYYINVTTGLIDKIVSEAEGERTEANLSEWTTSDSEQMPSRIVWTRNGQTIMEFRLTNFLLADAQ